MQKTKTISEDTAVSAALTRRDALVRLGRNIGSTAIVGGLSAATYLCADTFQRVLAKEDSGKYIDHYFDKFIQRIIDKFTSPNYLYIQILSEVQRYVLETLNSGGVLSLDQFHLKDSDLSLLHQTTLTDRILEHMTGLARTNRHGICQMRMLDLNGAEALHISNFSAIPKDKLQCLGQRSEFSYVQHLKLNEVYISPIIRVPREDWMPEGYNPLRIKYYMKFSLNNHEAGYLMISFALNEMFDSINLMNDPKYHVYLESVDTLNPDHFDLSQHPSWADEKTLARHIKQFSVPEYLSLEKDKVTILQVAPSSYHLVYEYREAWRDLQTNQALSVSSAAAVGLLSGSVFLLRRRDQVRLMKLYDQLDIGLFFFKATGNDDFYLQTLNHKASLQSPGSQRQLYESVRNLSYLFGDYDVVSLFQEVIKANLPKKIMISTMRQTEPVYYSVTLIPFSNSLVAVTFKDITEVIKAELSLKQNRDRLEKNVRELHVLLAVSKFAIDFETPFEQLFPKVISLITELFSPTDRIAVRITLSQEIAQTPKDPDCCVKHSVPLRFMDEKFGKIDIFRFSDSDETESITSFSPENRAILDAIGEMLSSILAKRDMHEQITAANLELTKTVEKLRKSVSDVEVLLRSSHHEVKNELASFIACLEMARLRVKDTHIDAILGKLINTVVLRAKMHDIIHQADSIQTIELSKLLNLYSEIHHGAVDISFEMSSPVEISSTLIQYLGMCINELVLNSIEHAFKHGERGHIQINVFKSRTGEVLIDVRDYGAGLPQNFDIKEDASYGLRFLQSIVKEKLKGTFSFSRPDKGACFSLKFQNTKEGAL